MGSGGRGGVGEGGGGEVRARWGGGPACLRLCDFPERICDVELAALWPLVTTGGATDRMTRK